MPKGKKKRSIEEKHSIELTDDEALEKLFGKEVRDKLKEIVGKDDKYREKQPHK